ncbi:MAG: hypothetical protein ACOVP1_00935 [Bacteroidia bacterium]
MIAQLKNRLKETYFEIIPSYQTNIPSKRKYFKQSIKFALVLGAFVWLFVFLFLKKGIWTSCLIALPFALQDLFLLYSFHTREIEINGFKKSVCDFSRKYVYSQEQRKYSILLGLTKLLFIFLIGFLGLYKMSLPETQVKFISEDDLVLVLQAGDTLYARAHEVDVSIREAENTYVKTPEGKRRIRYNYIYSDAYKEYDFAIGVYQRLNFLGYQDSLSRKFFAIKPFRKNAIYYQAKYAPDSLFERVLDDSLVFVEPFQVTISPEHYQRLVQEGRKWDFKWY